MGEGHPTPATSAARRQGDEVQRADPFPNWKTSRGIPQVIAFTHRVRSLEELSSVESMSGGSDSIDYDRDG